MKTHDPARPTWPDAFRSGVLPLSFVVLAILLAAGAYWVRSQSAAVTEPVPAPPVAQGGLASTYAHATGDRAPMTEPAPAEAEALAPDVEEVRGAVRAYPEILLSLVDAEPAVENGQFLGFRLLPVADAEFFQLLGLIPGDILSSINGVALRNLDEALEELRRVPTANGLTLTVWRDGQLQMLTY